MQYGVGRNPEPAERGTQVEVAHDGSNAVAAKLGALIGAARKSVKAVAAAQLSDGP